MKTLIIMLFVLTSSLLLAGVSTFNGQPAHWGWFGDNPKAGEISGPVVKDYLNKNWKKVNPFDLQGKIGNKNNVEFLWNITPDLVPAAQKSGSTYIVGGAKITNIVLDFAPDGTGSIYLYSHGDLVGRANCRTANKREGKNSQLKPGDYRVLGKEKVHKSKEFDGTEMLFSLLLDAKRGIYMHCGDISSSSGGCVRLSKPFERVLFNSVLEGTPVKVIHSNS